MSENRLVFLRTPFAGQNAINFEDDDEGPFTAIGGEEIRKQVFEPGDLKVSPLVEDGIVFVWQQYNAPVVFVTPPTMLMRKGGKALACWALTEPTDPEEVRAAVGAENEWVTEAIPLPDSYGWVLDHVDSGLYYDLDQIHVRASAQEAPTAAVAEPVEDASPEGDLPLYGDARMITPYDEADPVYAKQIIISLGARREFSNWKPKSIPLGGFIAMLCQHKEGKKDGAAFVPGDIVPGRRLKTAVKSLYAIGLDIDSGLPTNVLDRKIKALGVTAIRYTTHSHFAIRTTFPRDTVLRETKASEITEEVIHRFLRDEKEWDEHIIETAVYAGTEHEEKGIALVIEHKAMDRNRVVLPMNPDDPFDIAKEGATQRDAMARWAKVPTSLARMLGVPLDRSCLDPSRLFFFPRHDKGRPFDIALFGGPLFDWRSLTLDDAFEEEMKRLNGESKSGPNTAAGKKLGRWAMNKAVGFQIADAIQEYCPERIRFEKAQGQLEVECPFDDLHSNAGDPDDRGFFCVNAGDGDGEVFHASCRHDGCQGKRNIDFLAKMIEDDWLPESVLQDPAFNIAEEEEVKPRPEPEPEPEPTKEEKKSSKPDDPKMKTLRTNSIYSKVRPFIEGMSEESDPDQINEAVKAVLRDEKISGTHQQWCIDLIRSRIKVNVATMNRYVKHGKESLRTEQKSDDDPKLESHQFEFDGDFHFDEAVMICENELKQANRAKGADKRRGWGQPVFTCLQDRLMKMRERADGRLAFEDLSRDGLWSDLNKLVSFVRVNDQVAGKRMKVPEDVAKQCFEQAVTYLPQTPEVTYTPSYTADGKLLTVPKWYYEGNEGLNILLHDSGFKVATTIPEEPTPDDVDDALAHLEDVLFEFPFLDTDLQGNERREPSYANALAMLITPFMRRMIDGCTPVFFITKPVPGTGGTMLGRLPLIFFDGEDSMPMGYTQSEDEMKKYLVAAVTETRSHLFFDDVADFNNRVLLQAITARYVGGRLLGSSKTIERANNFGWIATGNNTIIKAEMERRICWIRLNAKETDIQARIWKKRYRMVDGRKEEITYAQWLKEVREETVYSILVLIQNWIAQEQRPFMMRSLVSFEDWAKKVGGVLQAAGIEGFLDNRRTILTDQDEAAIKDFVKRWHNDKQLATKPQSAKTLFTWTMDQQLDILEGNNDDVKKHRFYKRLQGLEGRVFEIGGTRHIVNEVLNDDMDPVWELVIDEDLTKAA